MCEVASVTKPIIEKVFSRTFVDHLCYDTFHEGENDVRRDIGSKYKRDLDYVHRRFLLCFQMRDLLPASLK